MDKRGQFYIIIVLVAGISIYGLVSKTNFVIEPKLFEDFDELSKNYVKESFNLINEALENGASKEQIVTLLGTFSTSFLDYAKLKNPSISLLYLYADGNDVTVKNYMDVPVELHTGPILGWNEETVNKITLNTGGTDFVTQFPLEIRNFGEDFSSDTFPQEDLINLNISGIPHIFELDEDQDLDLKVLLISTTGQVEQVYEGGDKPFDPF